MSTIGKTLKFRAAKLKGFTVFNNTCFRMVFVGAVILTHSPMAFDGDQNSPSEACRRRYETLDPIIRDKFTKVKRYFCDIFFSNL